MFLAIPAESPAKLAILGYAALFVCAILFVYVLVLIASLLPNRARPEEVSRAIFTYLMEGIAVMIMSLSGLTAVIGVLAGLPFPGFTYFVLLVAFAFGGFLYLRYEAKRPSLDPDSSVIPALLYRYALKLFGMSCAFLSGFTLLSLLFMHAQVTGRFWVNPLVLLLYGLFLTWTSRPHAIGSSLSLNGFDLPSLLGKKTRKS